MLSDYSEGFMSNNWRVGALVSALFLLTLMMIKNRARVGSAPPHGGAPVGGDTDIPDDIPLQHDEPIAAMLERMVEGQIWFNIPQRMRQGKDQTIVVRISKNASESISAGYTNEGNPARLQVFPYMAVRVDGGKAFDIKPLTPENQFVATDRYTEWQFQVVPLESGDQHIEVIVGVRVKIAPGDTETRFSPTYRKTITVEINRHYAIGKYWDANYPWISGLCGGILALIGTIIGILTYRKGRKDKPVIDNDRV
jgi:hypothetical protein